MSVKNKTKEIDRSEFTRTATCTVGKYGFETHEPYHADLEGPAGSAHGCGHDVYGDSLIQVLYRAINFCDKKGIKITELIVAPEAK